MAFAGHAVPSRKPAKSAAALSVVPGSRSVVLPVTPHLITHGRMASGPAIVSKRLRMQLSPRRNMLLDHKTSPSLQTLHETLLNLKTHLILDHKTLLDHKRLISRKMLLKRRRLTALPVLSLMLAQRTPQGASNSRNLLPAQVFHSSFCACRFNIRIYAHACDWWQAVRTVSGVFPSQLYLWGMKPPTR